MRTHVVALLLGAAAALAACGEQESSAPWLTYPGVAGHSVYLRLEGTPHDPSAPGGTVDCQGCHSGSTFTQFSCTGCHDQAECDPIHLGAVAGYAWDSPSCYGCHRDGTAAPANHTSDFFPVGTGTRHTGIGCRQCHLDLTRPHDTTQFACDTCHLAVAGFSALHTAHPSGVAILTVHTGEDTTGPPLTLTSPNCLRCHADGQVDRIGAHATGDRGFGEGNHRSAGCVTCHTAMRTGTKSFGTSWDSATGCTTCHRNGIPG